MKNNKLKDDKLKLSVIYGSIGILFIILAINFPNISVLYGFVGACFGPALLWLYQYLKLRNPDNLQKYTEKIENEKIELYDERKEMIRGKSARVFILLNWLFISFTTILTAILGQLGYIDNYKLIIWMLTAYMFTSFLAMQLIYKYINTKY